MIHWLQTKWGEWRAYRKMSKEIAPASFQRLSRELLDLADLASRLSPQDAGSRLKITTIRTEIEKLEELVKQPEFRHLSTGKRILLRQGLQQSRETILNAIESAPSPSDLHQ